MRTVFAVAIAAALPVLAHHSIMAEYDPAQQLTIRGVVANMVLRNPHSFVTIDEATANGTNVQWEVELAPPRLLIERGWSKQTLQPGATITFVGFRSKNNAHRAVAEKVTLPDGRTLSTWPGPDGLWPQPTLEEFKAKAP